MLNLTDVEILAAVAFQERPGCHELRRCHAGT
jgi:hypothetical protein